MSFIIRFTYVIFIYYFYQVKTGRPFEFKAGDSIDYHNIGNWIANALKEGRLIAFLSDSRFPLSDKGFPIWVSLIYLMTFRSIVAVRIMNALLSAWMIIFIYKLSKRNFGEKAARLSAIFSMLLPNFIYYTGLHIKETLMVFLVVAFMERADLMVRSVRNHIQLIIQVIIIGASLFLFRTPLAVTAWFALISALLLSDNRLIQASRKVVYVSWIIIAVLFLFSGQIFSEISETLNERKTNQEYSMSDIAKREGGNNLAKYGSTIVFIPLMLPSPIPTIVDIPNQENTLMLNGAFFTRNVYIFFVVLALAMIVKRKMIRQHILVLIFTFSYLLVLANSGFALSERFHLPAVPFLLILAGYGVTQITKRNARYYYIPYLIFISVVILGWNWFKLKGRGII